MYAPVTPEDRVAAVTLMCLLYGCESNARAQGAFPPAEAKQVKLAEAMEEAEPVTEAPTKPAKSAVLAVTSVTAGPSGVLRERNGRQKIPKRRWSTSSEETEEAAVNKGVPIGSGKTILPMEKYQKIKWRNYKAAVRSLLDALFPKSVLATHSLSGRPSPAFSHLPAKKRLNPIIVDDIVEEVFKKFLKKFPMGSIKAVITTKCADEAKIAKNLKKRKNKGNKRRCQGTS